MKVKNVADLVIDLLAQAGVKNIYGIVGDSLNALTESLRQADNIQWIHTRHEEVAAFAAGAHSQLTGQLTACAGSCGPGNLHLINGLYDCHRTRTPVIAIAAQIPSAEIGSDYFQETRPQFLFKECSHYCELISHASQLPTVLETAIRVAIGKKGVAVVVIPGDILQHTFDESPLRSNGLIPKLSYSVPQPDDLASLAALINESANVTILGGHGCEHAREPLFQLAEKIQSPIVHALGGKQWLEYDNPYDVGMTGMIGYASGYAALKKCDLLIMLGTDFPYREFYPKNTKIVQIDSRVKNLGRRCPLEMGLVGDIKQTLTALLPLIKTKKDHAHLTHCLAQYQHDRKDLHKLAIEAPDNKAIHPQFVVNTINELATEDAIFTCDVGTPTVWAARYVNMNGKRRLLGSFRHGSMASALPQAIGAQVAYPQRQVIALCGDGGFAMLMGDFITLSQLNLPVKVIIFNNSSLSFVEMEMKSAGLLQTQVDLKNPNFADMANAMGILGIRVEKSSAFKESLQQALAHNGPVLLDVVTNRYEIPMPGHTNLQQVKGIGLYAIKAVLNGQGDQLIDLVDSNLIR